MQSPLQPFLFLALLPAAHADAIAGAWEGFPTQDNTDAWSLYAYDDDAVAPPLWSGTASDINPYAYSFFLGGDGVWFFADAQTAQGAFVGDYGAQKIEGIDVAISIDPAEIDSLDIAVYASGPIGSAYYYSLASFGEEFEDGPNWYFPHFSFSDEWFYFQDGEFVAFQPGDGFLASISEVGLRVFPVNGVGEDAYVGVDDFILTPTVDAPLLTTAVDQSQFSLTFELNPGVAATLQTADSTFQWSTVTGQTNLTGSQSFTTPIEETPHFFRVATEEKLTPVSSS
ncbi:hypothetical protein HNR46_000342 [Haloferula luteola]|uniref:Uncharacterized protein n=1 Tax=Haloferula luteola TaxID=595692 RepID=A0A840VB53_9BACT|nr:hypothetical protein [Haloferula luteola]MBB5350121.1 hypothetical protein [Haloferula luteola]